MSKDGPKNTQQNFFVRPDRGGMVDQPGSKTLAGYTGPADPNVISQRLEERLSKYGKLRADKYRNRDAYPELKQELGALDLVLKIQGQNAAPEDIMWRDKLRAWCRWCSREFGLD